MPRPDAPANVIPLDRPWGTFRTRGSSVLCPDGKRRALARVAQCADSFFSVRAAVRYRGRTLSGFVDERGFHSAAWPALPGLSPRDAWRSAWRRARSHTDHNATAWPPAAPVSQAMHSLAVEAQKARRGADFLAMVERGFAFYAREPRDLAPRLRMLLASQYGSVDTADGLRWYRARCAIRNDRPRGTALAIFKGTP